MKLKPAGTCNTAADLTAVALLLAAVAAFALATLTGCADTGSQFTTTTAYGLNVRLAADKGAPVMVNLGVMRNEHVAVESNALGSATVLKATDVEQLSWLRQRLHTVLSIGKDAVAQPSAAQQMTPTPQQPSAAP